jgi:putative NADH-flavin reductase
MKILIFGASGNVGRPLVKLALRQHHIVTAFVRSPADFEIAAANLAVFTGNVTDPSAIDRAMKGQDAVISVLGVSRPRQPDPSVIQGVRDIVQSMQQRGIRRLIYLSCIGVSASRQDAGPYIRLVHTARYRHELTDHETKEAIVTASSLDWTIVRAPVMTKAIRSGKEPRSGEGIPAQAMYARLPRADVAEFLLKQVTDASFIRKSPSVLR